MKIKYTAAAAAAALILSCSNGTNVAGGVETGNGIVSGIVSSSAGSNVPTVVTVIPEKFNPVSDKIAASNCDTTSDGTYSVSVPAGTYNISAKALDGKESAFIRRVTVTSDGRITPPLSMTPASPCTVSLEKSLADGQLWIQGSLETASYLAGDAEAVFAALPQGAVLPALYRTESGVTEILAESFTIPAKALFVHGTDGFEKFTSLYYDTASNLFWAGTKLDGVFRYSLDGNKVGHDDTALVPELYNGVTSFSPGYGGTVYVTAGKYVLSYNKSQADTYTVKYAGSAKAVGAYSFTDASPVYVFGNEINKSGSFPYSGILSSGFRNDTVFAGTNDGQLITFGRTFSSTLQIPSAGAVSIALPLSKSGAVAAVSSKGLLLIKDGAVVHEWNQFAAGADDSLLAVSESSDGTLWLLGKNSKLYYISSDMVLTRVSGFEHLLPFQTGKINRFQVVDITCDETERVWLLTEDGALIQIQR